MERAHLQIHGRVQGVFFRHSSAQEARRLGLTGWVRNLPDGSVEAVVQGPPERVQEFIRWANRGPPSARVDRVELSWEELRDERDFRVEG